MRAKKFLKWHKKEYSKRQRVAVICALAPIFLVIIPFALFVLAKSSWLGELMAGPANFLISLILILFGWLIAAWSIYFQFAIGKGSPAPPVPTKKLVISGPYKYSRNPMVLGALVMYAGFAVLANSVSYLILVLAFFAFFLAYCKLIEEKELEIRFGKEYLEYKKTAPFLIPRFRK